MSTPAPLLLLIEDELAIRRFLRTSLANEGYRLLEAETGQQAIRVAKEQPPDLVLLDLGLPDMDGHEVLRQLREWLTAPVVVLSARDQEQEKVQALDNGADDYLTKPFSTAELLARIRVALRHASHVSGPADAVFTTGDLRMDLPGRRVFVADQEIHLTPIEYKLLATLVLHAGKVLTHRFLLQEVWGPHQVRETHYLRVFMAGLRRKIEADPAQPRYLMTEQGVGYRFTAE
ncbi:MAG: response regulator [Planctomycetes bacterium]|nr:response regulator [Planctomycetota bacterium]